MPIDVACYDNLARDNRGNVILTGMEPAIADLQVPIGATSVQSAPFPDSTLLVRVHTDNTCRIAFGENPTANSATKRMSAGSTEFFGVRPGHKVAVIQST
jgi:hypothetical protein